MPMDEALTKTAVKALDVLIEAELRTDDPARYGRIVKLCKHAHDLVQMVATHVKDVVEQDYEGNIHVCANNDIGVMEPGLVVNTPVAGRLRIAGGGVGQTDLVREIIAGMQNFAAPAAPKLTTAGGIHTLLDLHERLQRLGRSTEAVDRKVEVLLAVLDKEDVNADLGPAVLHPFVLRGHQAGANGEGLPGDRGDAVSQGEAGAGGAIEAGSQEVLAARR
jgi:hypothetical protein